MAHSARTSYDERRGGGCCRTWGLCACILAVVAFQPAAHGFSFTTRFGRGRDALQMRLRVPKPSKGIFLASVFPPVLQRLMGLTVRGGFRSAGRISQVTRRRMAATVSDVVIPTNTSPPAASSAPPSAGTLQLTDCPEGSDPAAVPILIRYTAGAGYKSLYAGCVKVLRETFPNVCIKKVILANMQGRAKAGIFEVVVGDQVYHKQKESYGVYLPMQDIAQILQKLNDRKGDHDDRRSVPYPAQVLAKATEDSIRMAVE